MFAAAAFPSVLTPAVARGVPAAFDLRVFNQLLSTELLGRRIETHARVASTMDLARAALAREGAQKSNGLLVLAEEQTAGVGRRGRSWDSVGASNSLLFSIVLAMPSGAALFQRMTHLNLAAPVAVARACATAGVGSARIKWPNDVWAGVTPRKLSGMLLNFGGGGAAVLGVGINVLEDMRWNASATSVATLLAPQPPPPEADAEACAAAPPLPTPSREALLATFCNELERLMGASTEDVLAEYREHDLLRGRTVRVHHRTREEDDPRDYDAEVLGVDKDGMLRVKGPGGESLLSGEEVSITPQL